MGSQPGPGPPLGGWAGYPLGFVVAVAVTIVAVAAGGTAHPRWTLAALAATAATIAAAASLRAALATGALCWALHTGFVLGRYGELTITADSLRAAALLAAVVVLAFGIACAVRLGVPRRDGQSRLPAPPMPGKGFARPIRPASHHAEQGWAGCHRMTAR